MVGNGPHHRGPCRYVYVARPAPYTKGNCLKVWAVGPPTMRHHRPPMRGTRDDERHSHLAGPRRQARRSSLPRSISQCTGWQRYRVSHMRERPSRPPSASF